MIFNMPPLSAFCSCDYTEPVIFGILLGVVIGMLITIYAYRCKKEKIEIEESL